MWKSVLVVGGPTASGKSERALQLACALGGDIINADSVQVYRGFDIGSGKPDAAARDAVPHHLYDIVDPWAPFDAAAYAARALPVVRDVLARGRLPIVTGGTGLYIRALVYGLSPSPPRNADLRAQLEAEIARVGAPALYERLRVVDPAYAARIHPNDAVRIVRALEAAHGGTTYSEQHAAHGFSRPRFAVAAVMPDVPLDGLDARIERRTRAMFAAGFINEVRALTADPRNAGARGFGAVGYAEVAAHLRGEPAAGDPIAAVTAATRRYARRQRKWFARQPPPMQPIAHNAPDAVWIDAVRRALDAAALSFGG